jgi:heme oxygenase
MPSWMLARLNRETVVHHAAADADRSSPLTAIASDRGYRDFLGRIYGFEAPLEAAFAAVPALADLVDLRARSAVRLLRCDLAALGVDDPTTLPRCRAIPPFRIAAEALGWMYVVERNALLHGTVRRHLEKRLPAPLAAAGHYLANSERTVGSRMTELGIALDHSAHCLRVAAQIVDAAKTAFRRQRHWFNQVVLPPHETTTPTRVA